MHTLDHTNDDDWSWLERYWISQFKAWGFNLLNHTDGGEEQYHFKHSDETKKKIGDKQRNRKLPKEWCVNISKGKTDVKFSKTHINNLSISHKGKSKPLFQKPVFKLDDKFQILSKYSSITEALIDLSADTKIGSISKACKGKLKSALGYHWCYAEDYQNLGVVKYSKKIKKSVLKINIDTEEIINKYESIASAAKDNDCHYTSISHVCNEKRGSVNGFIYVFDKDYESIDIKKIIKTTIKHKSLK